MENNMIHQAPDSYYIHNRETGKLELHFDKSEYDGLTDAQKQDIKSAFLWGRKSGCWISRCKEPNLCRAKSIAQALGLADGGEKGERLSFAQQQQRKAERAVRRADRFDSAAESAIARGKQLQKPVRDMHGDIAFFTQPHVNTSAGHAFTRRRDAMFAAFDRGIEEYRKSEYYRMRAQTARRTAELPGLKDGAFIARRIRECETEIRRLKKSIDIHEAARRKIGEGTPLARYNGTPITLDEVNTWLEADLNQLEAQLDKLGYYQDAREALGRPAQADG